MTREQFKAELERVMTSETKPVIAAFMQGTAVAGLSSTWLWKLWSVIEAYQVTDREMHGIAELIIYRRSQGILTYMPTDIELKQVIRDYREIEEMKAKKKAAEAQATPPSWREWTLRRFLHTSVISCVLIAAIAMSLTNCVRRYIRSTMHNEAALLLPSMWPSIENTRRTVERDGLHLQEEDRASTEGAGV